VLLLALFAGLAGAVTAVTPCVLPVLPALLSASGTGGRRRPVGVAAGLTVTFFATIVGLATVVDGVGQGDGTARSLAIAVLAGFGVVLLVPRLSHALEARLAGLSRLGPRRLGDGFGSGLAVGAALGFVYAPCAGPILAGVISVSATQRTTTDVVVVAAAYAIGSGAMLLLIAFGGRRVLERVRRAGGGLRLQQAMGVVMVLTAVAMAFEFDVRFQTTIADDLPAALVNPTRSLERSDAVERRLQALRGKSRFDDASARRGAPADLPRLGAAPEFAGTQRWFNTAGGRPLTLAGLRGRVVLIDFWTYTCINCLRTLPAIRALDQRYRRAGLTIVGVHTPEFGFEKEAGNVESAVRENRLRYAVAQDNDYATWTAWGNQYWPAKYLIDAEGNVRYTHFGEGGYGETEAAVRALLREAGARRLATGGSVAVETADPGVRTPETYLGAARARGFVPRPPAEGTHGYGRVAATGLEPSQFALGGTWRVTGEAATAVSGARLDAVVQARKTFLVLSSRGGKPRQVRVLVDGRPAAAGAAGADAHGGVVTVRRQRLYRLVSLPRARTSRLTLLFDPGVSGFAFTFG
jgi:cytochrome c biogenesis protein CcdA/thiol-disulfide isomerase/thioredoxin